MKKPIIGIVPLVDKGRESLWMLPGYMEGVKLAGGLPVMLPLTEDAEDARELAALCGGFIFAGGHDVSPAVYGEETLPLCGELCPERDRMETFLLQEVLAADKAALGICRGRQLLNAALGGTLYQDLPVQRPSDCEHHMAAPYDREAHKIVLTAGSPIADLLQTGEIGVNSCHHQAVKELSSRLAVMASAPDGVVEAVYLPEKRFVWAVQWHPEFSYKTDANSRRLFAAQVENSR